MTSYGKEVTILHWLYFGKQFEINNTRVIKSIKLSDKSLPLQLHKKTNIRLLNVKTKLYLLYHTFKKQCFYKWKLPYRE